MLFLLKKCPMMEKNIAWQKKPFKDTKLFFLSFSPKKTKQRDGEESKTVSISLRYFTENEKQKRKEDRKRRILSKNYFFFPQSSKAKQKSIVLTASDLRGCDLGRQRFIHRKLNPVLVLLQQQQPQKQPLDYILQPLSGLNQTGRRENGIANSTFSSINDRQMAFQKKNLGATVLFVCIYAIQWQNMLWVIYK